MRSKHAYKGRQLELLFSEGYRITNQPRIADDPLIGRDVPHEPGAMLNPNGIWVSDLDLPENMRGLPCRTQMDTEKKY